MTDEQGRLSAADVAAIAEYIIPRLIEAGEQRIEERFYERIGKGFWGVIWKVIVAGALFLAGWEIHRNGG